MIKLALATPLLAAAAVATLSAGAAYAQQTTLGPQSTTNNATTAVQPATDGASATSINMVSNLPGGAAPATYPVCSHRGQDRCIQRRIRR